MNSPKEKRYLVKVSLSIDKEYEVDAKNKWDAEDKAVEMALEDAADNVDVEVEDPINKIRICKACGGKGTTTIPGKYKDILTGEIIDGIVRKCKVCDGKIIIPLCCKRMDIALDNEFIGYDPNSDEFHKNGVVLSECLYCGQSLVLGVGSQ